jgi:hypothetical protein
MRSKTTSSSNLQELSPHSTPLMDLLDHSILPSLVTRFYQLSANWRTIGHVDPTTNLMSCWNMLVSHLPLCYCLLTSSTSVLRQTLTLRLLVRAFLPHCRSPVSLKVLLKAYDPWIYLTVFARFFPLLVSLVLRSRSIITLVPGSVVIRAEEAVRTSFGARGYPFL